MLQLLWTTVRITVLLASGLLLPVFAVRHATWNGLRQWCDWTQGIQPSPAETTPLANHTGLRPLSQPAEKTSFPAKETFSAPHTTPHKFSIQPNHRTSTDPAGEVQPVAAWQVTPTTFAIAPPSVRSAAADAPRAAELTGNVDRRKPDWDPGLKPWQAELEALGAVYCRLDSWDDKSWHRFQCRVAVPGKPGHSRHLEGSGNSVEAAVEQVLSALRSRPNVHHPLQDRNP